MGKEDTIIRNLVKFMVDKSGEKDSDCTWNSKMRVAVNPKWYTSKTVDSPQKQEKIRFLF